MYVFKIIKGNIHWADIPIHLSQDKIKRYTKRLDELNEKYKVVGDTIQLLYPPIPKSQKVSSRSRMGKMFAKDIK